MTDVLTGIDRVRLALACVDAGYPWEIEIEYVEELLSAFDALSNVARPQYLSNCLRAGACHGKCESTACTNYGKDIVVRRCVKPKQDGVVYPNTETP